MPPQVADTARASGSREARARPASPRTTSSSPTRERIATPFQAASPWSGDLVAALGELVAEQLGERVVGELGLLQADDVGPPLVEPRQQPRHALLDRVDVPGRDPHRAHRSAPSVHGQWLSSSMSLAA